MATEGDVFDKMTEFSARLNDLKERAKLDRSADEVLADLQVSLEELRVTDEELREQNAQLAAARESLLEQSQRYEELFNFAPDGYVLTDLEGRIQAANYAAAAMLRAPGQFLSGKPLASFVARADLRDYWARLSQVAGSRAGQVLALEVQIQPRGRQAFPCDVRATAARDATGRAVGVRWDLRDVTDRRMMEQALRLSEERYQVMLNSIQDFAVCTLDADGCVMSWSDGARRILGYHRSEIVEQPLAVFFQAEQAQTGRQRELLERAADLGHLESEESWVRSDGAQSLVNVAITALKDRVGHLLGFSVVLRDVTGERQLGEKLQRLNQELKEQIERRTTQLVAARRDVEDLSYSVSHDLRSPLRAIDGFSQMLLNDYADKIDAEGRRRLNVVQENSRKMSRLIDGLLAFSRIGRREMHLFEIDMTELAREVAGEAAPNPSSEAVSVQVLDLPPAFCDRAAMREVFVNLLGNAVKFSGSRAGAAVEIGGRQDVRENIYWVKDNGVGFAPEYAGQLFSIFRRLHSATEYEGLGVGLAIVKRIVTRHGGRVWAEGQIGEGATFFFALPNSKGWSDDCA